MQFVRVIILLFLYLTVQPSRAVSGWGDWQLQAPGGTTMNNFSSVTIAGKETSIDKIKYWYFYKNHILGSCQPDSTQGSFFVYNEGNGEVLFFTSEELFQSHVFYSNLEPLVWKRVHTDRWNYMDDTLILILFGAPYISVPFITLTVILPIVAVKHKRRSIRKLFIVLTLLFALACTSTALLQMFPSSW